MVATLFPPAFVAATVTMPVTAVSMTFAVTRNEFAVVTVVRRHALRDRGAGHGSLAAAMPGTGTPVTGGDQTT